MTDYKRWYTETRQDLIDALMAYCYTAHDVRNLYPCTCDEDAQRLVQEFEDAAVLYANTRRIS